MPACRVWSSRPPLLLALPTASRARWAPRAGTSQAPPRLLRPASVHSTDATRSAKGRGETAPFLLVRIKSRAAAADRGDVSTQIGAPIRIVALVGVLAALAMGAWTFTAGRSGAGSNSAEQ